MLLTHPRTLQAIENKEEKVERKSKGAAEYSCHLVSEMNRFNAESGVLVKSMMEGSDIQMERRQRLVKENIDNQEEVLRKRMESRGKSKVEPGLR